MLQLKNLMYLYFSNSCRILYVNTIFNYKKTEICILSRVILENREEWHILKMEQFLFKLQNKRALKSIILNDNVITFPHQIQKKIINKTKHIILGAKGLKAEIRVKRIKEFEIHNFIDQWLLLITI